MERWRQVLSRAERVVEMIRYEDFLVDKAGCIAGLAERLGLPVVADIRKDQDRQYQPRGDRNVSLDAFFGEKNLQLIESVCAEGMAHFGYPQRMSWISPNPPVELERAITAPI